jgi:hypothetical protein
MRNFFAWLENEQTFDQVWNAYMQSTSKYNLLTNRDGTLSAIAYIEYGDPKKIDNFWGEHNTPKAVIACLHKRINDFRSSWEGLKNLNWNDPDDREWGQSLKSGKLFNPKEHIESIYGSGGYNRIQYFSMAMCC